MNVRHCDMCLVREKPGALVMVFNLTRTINDPSGRHTTRGVGSLMLCGPCWEKNAKPRMRVVKAQAKRKSVRESMRRLQDVGVEVAA